MKVLLCSALLAGSITAAAEPTIDRQVLFKAGEDPAYNIYHIPGIVVTARGSVLAWCEARKRPAGASDWDDIRILLRRSTDEGVTWSAPVEITQAFDAFTKEYDWKVLATGPNHGIQLKTGRLVVPVWLSTGTGGNAHRPSVTATIYSDDKGATWRAGQIAMPCTEEWINPNEAVAVELEDGRVMLNARSESKAHRRLVAISPDGAGGWSEPQFDDALLEPICMAGIARYNHGGQSLILFSNPHNLARADGKEEPGKNRDRRNVSVKISYDEGRTWPVGKSIEPEWSGYSDLGVTRSGTILCFYGSGSKPGFAGEGLTLARFNLEWLLDETRP